MPLDAGSCVVTLSAPLAVARRMHFGLGAALTTGGGVVGGWALGAIGAAVVPSVPDEETPRGYSIRQVREAASEVGMSPEHVALALAEQLDTGAAARTRRDRWAQRLSGGPDALMVSRQFASPAAAVRKVVQSVLAEHRLTVTDPAEGPPLAADSPTTESTAAAWSGTFVALLVGAAGGGVLALLLH
jgi:hypothetical protein